MANCIDSCGSPAQKRGYCNTHYARALRLGTIKVERHRDPVRRFWSRVTKTKTCWVWAGSKTNGYGQIHFEGKQRQAHRVAYQLEVGPIPSGLDLDHLCRNRACVRPNHLEPVTPGENLRRGYGASGINGRKTHCPAGHEYTAENTRIKKNGHRQCLACVRRLGAARLARMKLERSIPTRAACIICSAEFERPNKRHKICSDACRLVSARAAFARHDQLRRPVLLDARRTNEEEAR